MKNLKQFISSKIVNLQKSLSMILIAMVFPLSAIQAQTSVEPLMTSKWQINQWPYNAAFPEMDGEMRGHMTNACGPTAIARLLHYHLHPVNGDGSHSFTNNDGIKFYADFQNTFYEWSEMKDYLSVSATEEEYWPVAELIFHSYMLLEDPNRTGRSLAHICDMLKKYMRYSDEAYVAYRNDYTREDYIALLKSELDAGRPLLMESWTRESTPPGEDGNHFGHYWNIDAYNENDEFRVTWNLRNFSKYFDIDHIIDEENNIDAYYLWALIQAKPDESQKRVDLTHPPSGYLFKKDQEFTLNWTEQNMDLVSIDFSYDGDNWTNIVQDVNAADGTYTWRGPDTYTKTASIRFRDACNPFYSFVYEGYEVYEQKQVYIRSPRNQDTYQTGTGPYLGWSSDGLYEITLEYKPSSEESWTTIVTDYPAGEKFLNWDSPFTVDDHFDIRIYNPDRTIIHTAENIRITDEPQVGGPYKKDDNTTLLMHLDESLSEEVNAVQADQPGGSIAWDHGAPGKGAGAFFDNRKADNRVTLEIPDQPGLNLSGSFTVECWFHIRSWDQAFTSKPILLTKPLYSKFANYSLTADSDKGVVVFDVQTNKGTLSLESRSGWVVQGVWYHVAMIHDAENRQIKLQLHNENKERIDVQILTYEEGTTISTGHKSLILGCGNQTGDYLDGYLDELRISNVVREFDSGWSGYNTHVSSNQIQVYPNPARHQLTIRWEAIPVNDSRVILSDMQGRKILNRQLSNQSGYTQLELPSLKPGIYWVIIEQKNRRESKRIVVY